MWSSNLSPDNAEMARLFVAGAGGLLLGSVNVTAFLTEIEVSLFLQLNNKYIDSLLFEKIYIILENVLH